MKQEAMMEKEMDDEENGPTDVDVIEDGEEEKMDLREKRIPKRGISGNLREGSNKDPRDIKYWREECQEAEAQAAC